MDLQLAVIFFMSFRVIRTSDFESFLGAVVPVFFEVREANWPFLCRVDLSSYKGLQAIRVRDPMTGISKWYGIYTWI